MLVFIVLITTFWHLVVPRNQHLLVSHIIENLNPHTVYSVLGWDVENESSIFFPSDSEKDSAQLPEMLPGGESGFAHFPNKLPKKVLIEWETRNGETRKY